MEIKTPDIRYQKRSHTIYRCIYHVVFTPKYRRRVLDEEIRKRLRELFIQIAKQYEFGIIDMEILPDYVHLVIECNPKFGIMECVRKLKGVSSSTLRSEIPSLKSRIPTLWTREVFISSVGTIDLNDINNFLEEQKGI